jgi:hypothetical protein
MTAGDQPVMFLPVPSPDVVSAARAYLTPRYAVGLDDFLWDSEQRPLPDLAAIDAVIGACTRVEAGAGGQPPAMDIAAVMVVLAAARQDMDRTEARLLAAARASGMGWAAIAGVLGVAVAGLQERYWQLTRRLGEPAAAVAPLPSPRPPRRARPAHRFR